MSEFQLAELIQEISIAITPYLPVLMGVGKKALMTGGESAVEALGEKLGESSWNLANNLWEKISKKVKEKDSLSKVAIKIDKNPEDTTRYLGAVEIEVEDILNSLETQDIQALRKLVEQSKESIAQTRTAIATGDYSVAITGGVSSSTFNFGMDNHNDKKNN